MEGDNNVVPELDKSFCEEKISSGSKKKYFKDKQFIF